MTSASTARARSTAASGPPKSSVAAGTDTFGSERLLAGGVHPAIPSESPTRALGDPPRSSLVLQPHFRDLAWSGLVLAFRSGSGCGQGVGKVVRPGQRVGSGAVNGTFASRAALRTAHSRRSTTATCRSRHHTCRESVVRGTKHRCRHTNTTSPTSWGCGPCPERRWRHGACRERTVQSGFARPVKGTSLPGRLGPAREGHFSAIRR